MKSKFALVLGAFLFSIFIQNYSWATGTQTWTYYGPPSNTCSWSYGGEDTNTYHCDFQSDGNCLDATSGEPHSCVGQPGPASCCANIASGAGLSGHKPGTYFLAPNYIKPTSIPDTTEKK